MTEYTRMASKAGDQVIDTVKKVQGTAVASVAAVSERIGEILPQFPELPFTERIPTGRELVTAYFDFAGDWLRAQREYALALIEALEPVTDKVLTRPKPRRVTAKKAA